MKSLFFAAVVRPDVYPILVDSSNSKGDEIFQVLESNGDFVGLRNSGKAHCFFVDGSARELSPSGLKSAGFTKIYDNITSPPTVQTL